MEIIKHEAFEQTVERFTSTIAIDDVEQTVNLLKKTLYILRNTYYCSYMIKSFQCRNTATLFNDHRVARFQAFERQARRKLLYLHRARTLEDIRQPPGNQLEALKGDRQGQYSIRINDQWRICFRWESGDVYDVEIVDYH